tara:strand:+ start:1050 stop:1319 length:270 start_codon:yes stop_codon:yes gene_type:complete
VEVVVELLEALMEVVVDLVEEQEETEIPQMVELEVAILHQQNQDQHLLHRMDMEMMVVILLLVIVVAEEVVPVVLVKTDNLLALMADLD